MAIADAQNQTLRQLKTHLHSIPNNPLPPNARKALMREMQSLVARYDQTLATLSSGGTMPSIAGIEVVVPDIPSKALKDTLSNLNRDWSPIKEQLVQLLRALNRPGLTEVRRQSKSVLQTLSQKENAFKQAHETASKEIREATTSDWRKNPALLSLIAGGIVSLMLAVLLRSHRPKGLAKAHGKGDPSTSISGIMAVLDGNMLVFNRDQIILNEYTPGAAKLLGKEKLGGEKLYELLAPIVPAQLAPALNKYIELLFDDSKVESLITSLNPLVEFEPQSTEEDQREKMTFRFRRLRDEQGVNGVLLTIETVASPETSSETPDLSSEENQPKDNSDSLSVFDVLLGFDADILSSFAHATRHSLTRINEILKSPTQEGADSVSQLHKKAENMLIEMHRLKGDFAALGLAPLVSLAQEFEDDTRALTANDSLTGDDFLPLTIKLESLMAYSDAFNKLLEKLGHEELPTVETKADRWGHLRGLGTSIAEDVNKQVDLTTTGLNEYPFDEAQRELVNDICIQLVRNAVVHGIENSEQRQKLGKPSVGRIDVSLTKVSDQQLELSIRDDGGGIDFEGIRQRATEKGLISAEKIASWSNRQLFSLLFRPEFSTVRNSGPHAGQGVGLNVIRQRVKEAGGDITVLTRKGRYSQFKISLPITDHNEATVHEARLPCAS